MVAIVILTFIFAIVQVGVEVANENNRDMGIAAAHFFQGIKLGIWWHIWQPLGAK